MLWGSPVRAEDEELRSLEVYNGTSSDIVTVNRSPRPASQTAENITVLTSEDIKALNAHTLADILANTTGIQPETTRTPGTPVNLEIQGANFSHVLVLVDDVPLNNLSDNFADFALIPAQIIERIEIVKGAASTTWGNALGGVVNVITKSPEEGRPFSGTFSGSLGKNLTADTRGEFSGTVDRFGYYLYGGNLRSDGLLPNNTVDKSSAYGKLRYDLPKRGQLTFSILYNEGSRGEVTYPTVLPLQPDFQLPVNVFQNDKGPLIISNLALTYPVSDHLQLEATARLRRINTTLTTKYEPISVPVPPIMRVTDADEYSAGGTLKVFWLDDLQRIVAGLDYDHQKIDVRNPLTAGPELLNRSAERLGIYLNDTLTVGKFAITPSARYDHSGTGDDLFSPSFGITYALSENSVLRGYTARGYSLTSLNRANSTEKVWTSQVGAETGEVPYLWLKGTLFRNDTWNIAVAEDNTFSLKTRQIKQGAELEARTLPLYNVSLSLGYTFINATDADTGRVLHGVPRHTLDLGIKYQDSRDLRALLNGRYLDWNGDPTDQRINGKYGAVIWDLHLSKTFHYSEYGSLEVFLSVWNLFDGRQSASENYRNTGRWGEAGVRCSF